MMRLLLPLVIALVGLGGGIGAAMFLRPGPDADMQEDAALGPCGDVGMAEMAGTEHEEGLDGDSQAGDAAAVPVRDIQTDPSAYVELGDQFVVPVVEDGNVAALVVLTLSVEIAPGFDAEINAHQPKLRDLFLRELLDHANLGGFRGSFTSNGTLDRLRRALRETGQQAMGSDLRDVLILDINRQEMS